MRTAIPDDGFGPDGPEATRLIEWVNEQNTHPNSKLTFTITRTDAAALLNLCAGWDPTVERS